MQLITKQEIANEAKDHWKMQYTKDGVWFDSNKELLYICAKIVLQKLQICFKMYSSKGDKHEIHYRLQQSAKTYIPMLLR